MHRWPWLKAHRRVAVVLIIYLVIATAHSLITPFTSGNDEWAHFLYTRFIAEHGRLPFNLAERQNKDEVGTKSDDPPLYHLLVAAAASGIEPARLLRLTNGNPQRQLADNVVVSYAFLVHNAYEAFPFQGEVLLWFVGRLVSIVFGGIVVILTYLTSLTLWPSRRRALVASALVAFLPAFVFHSSVMSYDSLGAVFTGLLLLASIKAIQQPERWRWWLVLGLLAGLAITTKYTSVLLPVEIVFVAGLAFRRYTLPVVARILAAGLVMLIATSWWFGFVIWHFNTVETRGGVAGILEPLLARGGNDSTAVSMTAFLFGENAVSVDLPGPARSRNYSELTWTLIESFWSAPIAEQFFLSPWLPLLFAAAGLLSAIGLVRVWQGRKAERSWLLLLLFHSLVTTPLIVIRMFLSFDPLEAVQGRHVLFPGASAIAILLAWGLWGPGRKAGQVVAAALLSWTIIGQIGWAAIVYPAPIPLWTSQQPEWDRVSLTPINAQLLPGMRLIGADWRETPGGPSLEVTLWWYAETALSQDYLVELRLLDESGQVASYTVGQPAQGRYPTRAWEPGDTIKDIYWLPLVKPLDGTYRLQLRLLTREAQLLAQEIVVALGQVSLTVRGVDSPDCATWFRGRPKTNGLLAQPYRLRSTFTLISAELPHLKPPDRPDLVGRKPLISVDDFHLFMVGPDWGESYQLVIGAEACQTLAFDLPARNFTLPEIPNELMVNFNHEVKLLGYELPARHIHAGGRLPLTLYWQALDYIGEDYQIFDNLLDHEQRRWGGYDRRAKDGYSTLLWAPGEIIIDRFGVPIDAAAPDGVYTIDIGLYRKAAAGFVSLPIVIEGRLSEQTSIRLGPVKVGGPPAGATTWAPDPQVVVNQSFGDQITLLGYDVAKLSSELKFTLYWQAEQRMATDYTTFFHLRNKLNETVAQKDQPPTNGHYPTSLWDSGEIVVDEITLTPPPPGEYTPVVGLYDFVTGARLLLSGADKAASSEQILAGPSNELHLESLEIP